MGLGIVKLGQGQWAVKDGNLLAAKETNGRLKNAEFTVSRGTRASYVGRDGLIKESNLQDVNLVNNGDFSELGSELVTSTSSTDNWINARSNSVLSVVGDTVRATTGTDDTFGISTAITTVIGKTYKINSFGARNNSSGSLIMRVSNTANLSPAIYQDVTTDDLTLTTSAYFVATATTTYIGFLVTIPVPTGEDYVETNLLSVKEVDPNDYWILGTGWSIEDGVATSTTSGGSSYLTQSGILTSSNTYQITFTVSNYVSGTVKATVSGQEGSSITANGTYTEYLTTTGTDFSIKSQGGTFNGSIDNISIQEVKTDTPRIDFTDNTDGHLLLEPQSTNLLPYSEDIASWNFITAGVVATSNYGISPDGTQNSTRIVFSDASQQYSHSLTTVSGVTGSIYIKGTSGETIAFGVKNVETVYTLDGSWQRFSEYGTATGNKITINTYGGATARDIQVWGGQMEALSYPTSYIPTNGSTVTRDADTCTGSGEAVDFNSEEGVLYAEISALADDSQIEALSLSDGTLNNRVVIFKWSTSNRIQVRVTASGTTVFNNGYDVTDITDYNKIALKWKANDFALWINGTEVLTDNSGTSPIGLNSLQFDSGIGTNTLYSKCKALRVYKEALSDTDLQNLTSL